MTAPYTEALIQALTAVQSIVGTVHLAASQEDDPDTSETLQTVLAVALTARNLLEVIVDETGPRDEPGAEPATTMGQVDEAPIFASMLRPDPATCEHKSALRWDDADAPGGVAIMCNACGEDPRELA